MKHQLLVDWLLGLAPKLSPTYITYSWLIHTTIYVTITALFIILFKQIFKNRLRAKWHFLIWAVLLIRFIVPVLPASPVSVFNTVKVDENVIEQSSYQSIVSPSDEDTVNPDEDHYTDAQGLHKIIETEQNIDNHNSETNSGYTIPIDAIITYVWLGGMIILLGYFITVLAIYRHTLKSSRREYDNLALLDKCRKRLHIERMVRVYYAYTTPMLIGLFKPAIYAPEGLNDAELEATLLHELNHMKHLDVLWSAIATIVLCLNWFNPIIWISFFMFKRDLEVYCDDRTLKHTENKQSYAMLLLKTATSRKKFVIGTTSLQSGEADVKRRIRYIAKFRKPSVVLVSVAVILSAAIAVLCLTNGINSESLVSVKLYSDDLRYTFNVSKDKSFSVNRSVDKNEYNISSADKTIQLSDDDYNKINSALGDIHDFINDEFSSDNELRYEVELEGVTSEHYYGDAIRSGYDSVLTVLISLSPLEVNDVYGAPVNPDYSSEDEELFKGTKLNPNIDYSYDYDTKTLSFTGVGEMRDYDYYTPWYDVRMPVNVVVSDGITRICDNAFSAGVDGNTGTPRYDFQYTKSIKLPDSVTKIGDGAFSYCNELEEINLPKNLTDLGDGAFSDCKNLRRIVLPEGITKLGESLFSWCENLEEVILSEKTEKIGDMAFADTKLKKISLPKTLKEIGSLAFDGCENITEIELPEGLRTIGSCAFYGCGLSKVKIPKTVKKIDDEAFGYKWNEKSDEFEVDKDFIIFGFRGTAAERYAEKNGIRFIASD